MIKFANGLATATLTAGLILGTTGVALANTDMAGHALMSMAFNKLNANQLQSFKGQEIYDMEGGKIGMIKHLARSQKTDQLYFVIDGDYLMGAARDRAAVPVDRLHWLGNEIVLSQKHPELPYIQGLAALPIQTFRYTG